jgi:glucan phosphoethanolaminetransferase (alkaline phosphatase superfamily)
MKIFTDHRSLVAISLLVALMMLPNVFWACVQPGVLAWVSGLIIPAMLLVSLFAFLGKKIWVACILLAPFAAFSLPETFYIFTYLRPTSAEILATLVATTPREISEFLGRLLLPIMASILTGLSIAILAVRWSYVDRIAWKNESRSWVIAASLTIPIAASLTQFISSKGNVLQRIHSSFNIIDSLGASLEQSFPFGVPERIAEYLRELKQLELDTMKHASFRFGAHLISSIRQRQIYVLVIGESSRRDHWQLFGYQRETNPELSHIANLITVPDMVTSWPATIMAVPLAITRKPITDANLGWKEASVLRAMAEAGYNTYWISNQLVLGEYESPVSIYAYEAKHVSFLNHASWNTSKSYDEALISPLGEAIKQSSEDLFIVLHTLGSHTNYSYRYPMSYKRFSPGTSDPGYEDRYARINNDYDNSILYTDHVLASVIDTLKQSNAVTAMLYESDHGEDLPSAACNLSAHGNETPYDFRIPALLWFSTSYAALFPERISAFRENATKRTLSADTFASLLDMAGVGVPGNDPTWSLFDKRWVYRPRLVNDYWQTDIDRSIQTGKCKLLFPAVNHGKL